MDIIVTNLFKSTNHMATLRKTQSIAISNIMKKIKDNKYGTEFIFMI